MKPLVISIGTDRKLLEEGSAVARRIATYGFAAEEIHIVVCALRSYGKDRVRIAPNVWVYPTYSLSRWLYVYDAFRIARRIARERKHALPALVTVQDPFECGLAGLLVHRSTGLPLEVQVHTDPTFFQRKSLLSLMRSVIAHFVFAHARCVRVVCEFLKDTVEKKFRVSGEKIHVLPVYIDTEVVRGAPPDREFRKQLGWSHVIVCVARLMPEKNVKQAIEVLSLVCATYPDAGLVVVGSGKEEGALKRLVQKRGLVSRVVFLGWHAQPVSIVKVSDVFLQTSHVEGYGMALVEAGLAGTPVVTVPVGIAYELTHEKDAYVCAHGDTSACAHAIMTLFERPEIREEMVAHMRQTLSQKILSKDAYIQTLGECWSAVVTATQ